MKKRRDFLKTLSLLLVPSSMLGADKNFFSNLVELSDGTFCFTRNIRLPEDKSYQEFRSDYPKFSNIEALDAHREDFMNSQRILDWKVEYIETEHRVRFEVKFDSKESFNRWQKIGRKNFNVSAMKKLGYSLSPRHLAS